MGSRVKAKVVNSLMRVRAREGDCLHLIPSFTLPFVFVEKARCFSRIVVEYFRKVDELQLEKERLLL